MTITRAAQTWTGTDPVDIDEYLAAFSEHGYPVQRVVHAACAACQSVTFRVRLDEEEGCVERTCDGCGHMTLMLDSADYVDEAALEFAECPCGGGTFNAAIGFALYDDEDVRWVYLGLRCTQDGTLGVYADWKIDYAPSHHLVGAV